MMVYAVIWIAFMLNSVAARHIVKNDANEVDVDIYLKTYGYLSASKASTDNDVREGLTRFQKFAGIAETGEADQETVSVMQMPRCGMKDVETTEEGSGRQKRYATMGGKWNIKPIVFGIFGDSYPTGITEEATNRVLQEAFQHWQNVSGLTFTLATPQQRTNTRTMHIGIRFARGFHGDGSPFDGRGGVLAHAYFPNFGGTIHFDKDENWRVGFGNVNLLQVAVHEIGHSLGLGHSNVRAAVMAPVYFGYDPNFKLHIDDIEGIQSLYGLPSSDNGDDDSHDDDDDDDDSDDDGDEDSDDDSDEAIISSINLRMGLQNIDEPANLDMHPADHEDSTMVDTEHISKGHSLHASALPVVIMMAILCSWIL